MPPSKEQDPDILGSFRPTQVVTSVGLASFTANADTAPSVRYAEGECSSCHQLLPKNRLRKHSISRVTGYSSGATWHSAATNSADIRKSLVTRGTPIKIDISFPRDPAPEDKGEYFFKVHLRDTFLLAPTGSRSLAEIGNLVGCPKIALSEDPSKEKYYKENMNVLLKDDWPLFQRYALNDAEICVRYFEYLSNKYCELRGKRAVPVALSSIGVRLLVDGWNRTGIDPIYTVGKETVTESIWVAEKQNFRTLKSNIYLEEISWHLDFATECYHGGRNEQFWFGPSFEDDWSDYDLTGAYPTAMALIGLPAWHKIKPCSELSEFTVDQLGFACVDFEFPDGTRYPTLPIRSANGIIFPLKGRSYCSTPEIEVAQKLGCEIDLRHGVIIPQDTETKIFQDFLIDSIAQRNAAETNLERQFWKELTNSCYGKTAQGLRRKRVFSVQKKRNEQLKESQITNPFFAAYITSFVRAVLGEIINDLPENKTVFSVTTDGFITNATDQEIEVASRGTLASKYSDSRLKLAGSGVRPKLLHQQLIDPIAVLKPVCHGQEHQRVFGKDGILVC